MNTFFNKEEYQLEDINQLIKDEIEESMILEYKRSEAFGKDPDKIYKISKTISSFANSDGGIIIYGIQEENHKPKKTTFIDGKIYSKEWLENIIRSNIHRPIEGIKIFPLRDKNKLDKSIYVVKVPSDSNAPHMANDNKYYRRYNFQSVPMEEYEIRNLYFKKESTELKILSPEIRVNVGRAYLGNPAKIDKADIGMIFRIQNTGKAIEKLYKFVIAIPHIVHQRDSNGHLKDYRNNFSHVENGYSIFSYPNSSPLFQGEIFVFYFRGLNINHYSIEAIITQPINLKLYYSSGIDELSVNLKNHFMVNEKLLTPDDFIIR